MRTFSIAPYASGVVLGLLLAGCSGGNSQPPAFSLPASSLEQRPAASTAPGFMQAFAAQTNLMYMSSWGTASVVDIITMSGELVGQITNGLAEPEGLFVDASGSLWVANVSNVLVYARGSLSPNVTLTDSIGYPVDVTVCPNGTAYVANLYNISNSNTASIQVYPPGSTSPSSSLNYATDFRNPFLTCDAKGNVFAAILTGDSVGDGRVIEFPLGREKGAKDLGIALQSPGGIKPDNAGNVLVTDLIGHTITEYTEGGLPTGTSIATGTPIEGIAVSRDGKTVLGANPNGPNGITWSYPGGEQKRVYTCCSRIGPPLQNNSGVAFAPGQKGI